MTKSVRFTHLIKAVELYLSGGYAAHSDWATIHFKNELISAFHLRSYNG